MWPVSFLGQFSRFPRASWKGNSWVGQLGPLSGIVFIWDGCLWSRCLNNQKLIVRCLAYAEAELGLETGYLFSKRRLLTSCNAWEGGQRLESLWVRKADPMANIWRKRIVSPSCNYSGLFSLACNGLLGRRKSPASSRSDWFCWRLH